MRPSCVVSTDRRHSVRTQETPQSPAARQAGVVDHAPGAGRLKLWYLAKRGNNAIETIGTRAEHRRKQVSAEQAAGPLRMHTLAVNDVGIAFVNAARERRRVRTVGMATRDRTPHHSQAQQAPRDMVIADSLLTYTQQCPDRTLSVHQRFIELDRATVPLQALWSDQKLLGGEGCRLCERPITFALVAIPI